MKNGSKSLFLIQNGHLFPTTYLKGHENDLFLMIEDREQLESYKFHKHRLVFYLSAMRHYAHEVRHYDYNLIYLELPDTKGLSYEKILEKVLKESSLDKIVSFEIEDGAFEKRIRKFCDLNGYELEIKASPQFLVSRIDFKSYLEQHSRPFLKSFYEDQRSKLNILMEPSGEPVGGQFSFDDEARLKWSHESGAPKFPFPGHDEIDHKVILLVDKEFSDHRGEAITAWYPTSRKATHEALMDFCKYRLAEYGPYEDALCPHQDFLFHSVLSPSLNVGLLTPSEILETVLSYSSEKPVPLNSLERFIKKIIGYREYVHGIYQNFHEHQEQSNFWKHNRIPNENWYLGKTKVPPLDDAIKKAIRLSYNHHTERLKVLGNMMNLAEINPAEARRWFMEMHLDATPWAMSPNINGIGPHLYRSNYWLKISTYTKGEWCQEVDGLYWRFVDKHQDFFNKRPKLAVVVKKLLHLPSEQKEQLWKAADAFLLRNTTYS